MPVGSLSPLTSKRPSDPSSCDVMGCFHGFKLSLAKWTLLILSNDMSSSGISLNPVDLLQEIKRSNFIKRCFYSFYIMQSQSTFSQVLIPCTSIYKCLLCYDRNNHVSVWINDLSKSKTSVPAQHVQ